MADLNTWLLIADLIVTSITTIILGITFRSKCCGGTITLNTKSTSSEDSSRSEAPTEIIEETIIEIDNKS